MNKVEVELNIDASEEMMAAAKAANDKPLMPTGAKLCISQG